MPPVQVFWVNGGEMEVNGGETQFEEELVISIAGNINKLIYHQYLEFFFEVSYILIHFNIMSLKNQHKIMEVNMARGLINQVTM